HAAGPPGAEKAPRDLARASILRPNGKSTEYRVLSTEYPSPQPWRGAGLEGDPFLPEAGALLKSSYVTQYSVFAILPRWFCSATVDSKGCRSLTPSRTIFPSFYPSLSSSGRRWRLARICLDGHGGQCNRCGR